MKVKLIYNPAAGRGRAKNAVLKVQEIFHVRGVDYSIDSTFRAGGATTISRMAVEQDFKFIVVVGGDGTVNEVVNGIVGSDAVLGIVPAGSGNDFSKMLGISENTEAACDIILNGPTKKIDLGKINDRYFVNGVGIGFDAFVAQEAAKRETRLRGFWLYFAAFLSTLAKYRLSPLTITLKDGLMAANVLLVTIGNGQYFGGGFRITPEAKIDDGLLDVCIINTLNKLTILRHLPKILKGTHLTLPYTITLKLKEITLNSSVPVPIHVDGEILEDSRPYRIQVVPQKLAVKYKP